MMSEVTGKPVLLLEGDAARRCAIIREEGVDKVGQVREQFLKHTTKPTDFTSPLARPASLAHSLR